MGARMQALALENAGRWGWDGVRGETAGGSGLGGASAGTAVAAGGGVRAGPPAESGRRAERGEVLQDVEPVRRPERQQVEPAAEETEDA